MKNLKFIPVLLLFVLAACQSNIDSRSVVIMSYNVENLFDTVDDPTINDDEFTPNSKKMWTEERYNKKLNDIAKVIREISSNDFPAVVALQEIENRKVLEDLVYQKSLKKANYGIVHYDSPDKRGIDVALLYDPNVFNIIKSKAIRVDIGFPTRDILYAQGKIGKETFHIYVNHWPSRIGGLEETEQYRITAAKTLNSHIEEVLKINSDANIIIMGDMNDEPQDKSLYHTLNAKLPTDSSNLVNLLLAADQEDKGTYNYRGNWNMLDNIIVSKSLLDKKGLRVKGDEGHIYHSEWMEYHNNKGGMSPNRTYAGPNYTEGVSDHFPVYFKMVR